MDWKKGVFKVLIRTHRRLQRLLGTATVGVRILVVNSKQEILLVEHTYIDGWHFPGGGVNHMEPTETAAIRELEEETGVIAKNISFFQIYVHNILGVSDYPALYIVTDFEIQTDAKPSPEIKQAKWFALSDLPKETTDSTKVRLTEYFEKTKKSDHW
jgi:ADP-ribose pyrophosphatase YjhB (NUDIX family)